MGRGEAVAFEIVEVEAVRFGEVEVGDEGDEVFVCGTEAVDEDYGGVDWVSEGFVVEGFVVDSG